MPRGQVERSLATIDLGTRTGKGIYTSAEFLSVRKTWEARVDAAYRGLLDRAGAREVTRAARHLRMRGSHP